MVIIAFVTFHWCYRLVVWFYSMVIYSDRNTHHCIGKMELKTSALLVNLQIFFLFWCLVLPAEAKKDYIELEVIYKSIFLCLKILSIPNLLIRSRDLHVVTT